MTIAVSFIHRFRNTHFPTLLFDEKCWNERSTWMRELDMQWFGGVCRVGIRVCVLEMLLCGTMN